MPATSTSSLPAAAALPDEVTLDQAEQLGYPSRYTLRRYIRRGLLPARMVGNSYRVRVSELAALDQRVASTPLSGEVQAQVEVAANALRDLHPDELTAALISLRSRLQAGAPV
ncbi:helix-turn-helix domain-containing protein [Gordonia paraffinivorans]|uniref:helix-turn-helix domain-containing protein n=1 Tax=Gordonia paraffinivorans TaxID=175628 RepID=UPI0014469A9C|nr:helix-turn-helix domain-containing protein [Gordonia paraffinivorans]